MAEEDKKSKQREVSDTNNELVDKVKQALNDLGADVQAEPQIFIDKGGFVRVMAIPRVIDATKLNKDEESSDDEPGEGQADGKQVSDETDKPVRTEPDPGSK